MADRPLALILAAGGGTRLRPRTDRLPKCLLPVRGRALLDYQLEALAAAGVGEFLLVTGYLAEQVEKHVARSGQAGRARTLVNPAFAATNNLYSLWVAAEEVAGRDVLCLHADVLFHPDILKPCLESTADVCAVLDRTLVEETMKAAVAGGRVLEISKRIPPEKQFGTFLGIARFAPRASAALPEVLEAMIEQPGNRQAYFTACLPQLAAHGLEIGYTLTDDFPWIEIDTADDLAQAEEDIVPALQARTLRRQ
jgi:choline kinase